MTRRLLRSISGDVELTEGSATSWPSISGNVGSTKMSYEKQRAIVCLTLMVKRVLTLGSSFEAPVYPQILIRHLTQ